MIPKKWRTLELKRLAWEILIVFAVLGLGAAGVLAVIVQVVKWL